ncbi:MAG: carboxypeptidase regulatory-like domain-containing protein [bacterium]
MSRIIAVMIFILGFTCQSIASTNLLQNPDFESGSFNGWQIEGTATSGVAQSGTPLPQAYFQPVQVIAHSGNYAAFNLTANFKRIGSIFSQEIDVLPDTNYEVGFGVLHGHPSQQVKIYPQIMVDGKPIGSLTITGGKGYGTSTADFQQIKGEFVTTHEQQRVRISFVSSAGGLALTGMSYDDFFVICSKAMINISPTSSISGTPVCLSGWNFQPGEQVILKPPGTNTNITANENGAFCTTLFTIPPTSSGTLTVTATGASSGRIALMQFNIIPRGDYGDAPNSTIYPMNTGYFCKPDDFTSPDFLTYQASFPIIFHRIAGEECLGKGVSLEAGVDDAVYDEDGVPNIESYKGRANQDSDDGLVLPVDLIPGAGNTVQFVVSVLPDAPNVSRYINILFDWNQDGKWSVDEWAVSNQVINIMPGESRVIASTPFVAGTNTGGCWMRLVLTREPVTTAVWDGGSPSGGGSSSGRGSPSGNEGFEYGESEDYLINIAAKCDLWIRCSAPKQSQLGQVITYRLEYGNQGQALVSNALIAMNIPQGLTYLNDTKGAMIDGNMLIDKLYPGQQGLFEISLRVEPWGGSISDIGKDSTIAATFFISCDTIDIEPTNNRAVCSTTIISTVGNGVLSGRILNAMDSMPIPGALVKTMQYESSMLSGMTMTNAAGEYTLTGLSAGTYTVSAELEGYTTRCYQGIVVINADGKASGVDILLMPMLDVGVIAFVGVDRINRMDRIIEDEGIYVINRVIGVLPPCLLTHGSAPSISPDGERIVFVRKGNVWVINTNGKDERQLTSSGYAGSPSFSPDGKQIVFCNENTICTINIDGTGYRQLVQAKASYPAFSPDGSQIVFSMNGDVYLMDTNGQEWHKLTNTPEIEYASTFSPDGTRVMFTRCNDLGATGIWTMNRNGGQAQMIADNSFDGRFSPDGRQVVFVSASRGSGERLLYVVNRDGGQWKKIATDASIAAYPSWGCSPVPIMLHVWPGDTNNDGMVNERDVFPIAVWWDKTGAARNGTLRWQTQSAIPWDDVAATYADANGDGKVNVFDVLPIAMNWGKNHTVTGSEHAPGLCPENIDHARYIEMYKAMDAMLNNISQSDAAGMPDLKCALHGFIEEASPSGILPEEIGAAALLQNYPNPFNPECWIPFELSEKVNVVIRIYNISGQLVRTLNIGEKEMGVYTTQSRAAYWNGKSEDGEEISSGVYFYQMRAGNRVMTKRAVVLK